MKNFRLFPPFFAILIALLNSACNSAQSIPTPLPVLPSPIVETQVESPTSRLIFIAAPDVDPAIQSQIESIVQSHAQANSLDFEFLSALAPFNPSDEIAKVVLYGDFSGLDEIASQNISTRFILIGPRSGAAPENVSLFSLHVGQEETVAFLSGYTAALVADDWRIGALYTADEILLANAFLAGAEYFCGACDPDQPPDYDYPHALQVSDLNSWLPSAQTLQLEGVNVAYLTPNLNIPEIQQFFTDCGIYLISSLSPGDESAPFWLATIAEDIPALIASKLPTLLDGQSFPQDPSTIIISNLNNQLLTAPRLENILQILADIQAGWIGLPSQN